MEFLLLVLATVFGLPLLATCLGVAASGRIPSPFGDTALLVQGTLVALLIGRFTTLPGDHFYVDHSACHAADAGQRTQLYGLFLASIAAAAASGFGVAGGRHNAAHKVGLLAVSVGVGLVALFTVVAFAFCDPT